MRRMGFQPSDKPGGETSKVWKTRDRQHSITPPLQHSSARALRHSGFTAARSSAFTASQAASSSAGVQSDILRPCAWTRASTA